ncbi:MAG: hypothetical protein IJ658_10850 [Kiritimatiellae bacterium]|nr:hypothetical protein [Kiritimatiellia bacterium]
MKNDIRRSAAMAAIAGLAALAAQFASGAGRCAPSLWNDFSNPPLSARPWCYWWWINGHADKETIAADLEAISRLGFGGVLMFDSRGYWDDENHLVNPKAEIVWGSPEWYDRVEFAMRECARLGLVFTMNASASGGTLNGFIDGKEYETDVMNRDEVAAHLDRAVGPLLKRAPDLVGKTFTHIYSVSYEGNVRTGGSWKTIKDSFYATMRKWAHDHGLQVYSESGGPWFWGSGATKLDCDQLDMLAHNDFPQGEFWPLYENGTHPQAGRANKNGRFFSRAAVLSARREGRRIASLESFTHMHRHWTADPAFLKPLADIAFADGVNRLVWHTFTCSPKKFGVPGAEYFAGSHVNRNVTWHKDAGAFVRYIWRCQALLQRGEPVDDGEFVNVSTNYHGWGRFRKDANAQFTATHRREGDVDYFFVAGEGKGEVVLNAAQDGRAVEIWDAVTAARKAAPAVSSVPPACGRASLPGGMARVALDLPTGGSCFVVFAPGGTRSCATEKVADAQERVPPAVPLANPWRVSFSYHPGIAAAPPEPVTMAALRDWTTCGESGKAESTSLRYFSGTAAYRTTVDLAGSRVPRDRGRASLPAIMLSLGELPTGLAHVFVNGKDCGVAWCAPWEVDISSAVREGANDIEIRYTNNWANRLVGDCFLEHADRVTTSTMRYSREPRAGSGGKQKPTCYSGFAISDPLQPSGLLGPVEIRFHRQAVGKWQ